MKKAFVWLIAICLCVAMLGGCATATFTSGNGNGGGAGDKGDKDNTGIKDSASGEFASGTHHAEIVVKGYGTIALELDADTAPITVSNFCELAKAGFYDGLTFHRIISGFMIQGGDPNGNGTGGAKQDIKGEFLLNGVQNNINHVRGVISMARATPYDSASSQFFIMHEDAPHLDGQYAAFGKVTSGMEVVDAICQNTPVQDGNGTTLAKDQPKIETIRILD